MTKTKQTNATSYEIEKGLYLVRPNSLGTLAQALRIHAALVNDRQGPSEWAAPRLPAALDRVRDAERFAWLDRYPSRLEDALGRVNNEGCSLREAIDWFMAGHG